MIKIAYPEQGDMPQPKIPHSGDADEGIACDVVFARQNIIHASSASSRAKLLSFSQKIEID